MAPKKKAMTSEQASKAKKGGHKNEQQFADLIDGTVMQGSPTKKPDVLDALGNTHSVKCGEYWQIFLYGENRLEQDTFLQETGEASKIMLDCLREFPPDRAKYVACKQKYKEALRPHMRRLLAELQKPGKFAKFLDKAIFNGGNAEYLSFTLEKATVSIEKKRFNTYKREDVISAFVADLTLDNSRARKKGDTSEQKVVLKSKSLDGRNVGEIELRNDSVRHYKQMKFRLKAIFVAYILDAQIRNPDPITYLTQQTTTHGKAVEDIIFGKEKKQD